MIFHWPVTAWWLVSPFPFVPILLPQFYWSSDELLCPHVWSLFHTIPILYHAVCSSLIHSISGIIYERRHLFLIPHLSHPFLLFSIRPVSMKYPSLHCACTLFTLIGDWVCRLKRGYSSLFLSSIWIISFLSVHWYCRCLLAVCSSLSPDFNVRFVFSDSCSR